MLGVGENQTVSSLALPHSQGVQEHTHMVDVVPRFGAGLGRIHGWLELRGWYPTLATCPLPNLTSTPSLTRRGEK